MTYPSLFRVVEVVVELTGQSEIGHFDAREVIHSACDLKGPIDQIAGGKCITDCILNIGIRLIIQTPFRRSLVVDVYIFFCTNSSGKTMV